MKKTMLILIAVLLLVPSTLFAAPSDEEVGETISGVMAVYGLSIMSALFGGDFPEESMEMEVNEDSGEMIIHYKDFSARTFLEGMGGMLQQMSDDGETLEISFDTISGTISATSGGKKLDGTQIDVDVRLTGGKVRTLEMSIAEDGSMQLKANGRRYSNVEEIFAAAGLNEEE